MIELESGKAWLEQQYNNWQKVAKEREQIITEQRAWIEQLEGAKTWLEQQSRSWEQIAHQRQQIITEQQMELTRQKQTGLLYRVRTILSPILAWLKRSS